MMSYMPLHSGLRAQASDGIMVARGDLGVEMAPEDVPIMQKRIVDVCKMLGKPTIIATQMLESMIDAPTPTRAECSDIATAIYDGADAVMLSAESAAGLYPEEAVTMQRRVISRVEADGLYRARQGSKRVIQRRFNVSVPRARVPETAPTLRERSER